EVEPRVDLQQMQAAPAIALEVNLRDASEAEPPQHVAPQVRDIWQLRDLDRAAQAVVDRIRTDLAPRELAGDGAARGDVRVVALDRALRPRAEVLDQQH